MDRLVITLKNGHVLFTETAMHEIVAYLQGSTKGATKKGDEVLLLGESPSDPHHVIRLSEIASVSKLDPKYFLMPTVEPT